MFYMSNRLGAWQVSDDIDKGKVEFKLFFPKFATGHDPQIQSIKVSGDFQSQIAPHLKNWDFGSGLALKRMETQDGIFWSY